MGSLFVVFWGGDVVYSGSSGIGTKNLGSSIGSAKILPGILGVSQQKVALDK